MRRVGLALAVAFWSFACASAPKVPPAPPVDLGRADTLVTEGCYDCLIEARNLYVQAAASRLRPTVVTRLFQTHILLGLRERELALDPAAHFDAAAALLPELPATYSGATFLEMARAILPDQTATPYRDYAELKRPAPATYTAWQTSLQSGDADAHFRRYLSISLDCSVGVPSGARVTPAPAGSAAPPSTWASMPGAGTDPPGNLLTYRRANCARTDRVVLSGLAEGDERFLEAGVFAGRVRSPRPTSKEIADARAWLGAARDKWSESPVVSLALGALYQTIGDCKVALGHYNRTLDLRPRHEGAHLGRLICLSYTLQYQPAIAEASQMIDEKVNEGEARYWRAWNHRETGKLPEARVDSDRMKQILYNDRAMLLAGQIEYDMGDLDIAERDLAAAYKLNDLNCVAPWYLGLVQLKRQAWTPTADAFVKAMYCYESAVKYDESKLDEMKKAENVDETFRAAQIAGFEAAIREDTSQQSASAFNAAVNYARANNRDKALEYCDLAAKDPARAAQAAELRALIVK